MALEQSTMGAENVEKSTQRDRLCTAVQFLLNCFGSMHHLKMSKCICFVLEDVRTFLLGMNVTSRMEAFSKLPSIMMDDLGFVKNMATAILDLTIVTKDELLPLFVVCHLSLNGKSHFEKIVKHLKNLAPQVISMILSCESTSGRLDYLSKYPQYFQLDDEGYLELDNAFFSPFKESSNSPVSLQTDVFLQCEDHSTLPNTDSQARFLSDVSKSSNPSTKNKNEISEIGIENRASPDVSLRNQNTEMEVIKNIKTVFSNESATSSNVGNIPGEAKLYDVRKEDDSSLSKNILSHASLENTASETTTVVYQSTALKMADRICTMVREGIVFLFEHFKCRIDLHLVCVVLHALHEAKRLFLWLLQDEQIALVENILAPLRIAGVEDNSVNFLKHSAQTFKLKEDQKNILFISYAVSQSEELHYSTLLGMFEKHKMDLTELMQIDVYFKFKSDFFSIDESECIRIENFPPAKWMAESLSSVPTFFQDSSSTSIVQSLTSQVTDDIAISFEDLSLDQTRISKTVPTAKDTVGDGYKNECAKATIKELQTKNVSGYPQDTLDYLSVKLHDSIAYLLQFFKLNAKWKILELVLHVAKDCALFFALSAQQQLEVIRASFQDFYIDEHGRVFFASTTKQREFKSCKSVKMLLCMSFIISRKRIEQDLKVLSSYHEYTGEMKHVKDAELLELLYKREDIFLVSKDGYVSLVNVPIIKFNYVCILMADRIPMSFNTEAVTPIKLTSPMIFNTSALMLETTCSSVLQSPVEKNGNGVSVAQIEMDVAKVKTFTEEKKSKRRANSLAQDENVSMAQHSKDETRTLTETDEDKIAKMVKDGIFYLSQRFVLEVDDLTSVFYVLQDVRSYLLKLELQSRDEFVKKSVSHLVVSAKGSVSSAESISDSCSLKEEEKIALFITLLLRREKKLHYTQIFDKLFQKIAAKPTCVKTVIDLYEFVTTWNNVFFVCPLTDFVKLLPILAKNGDVCSGDNVPTDTNIKNFSVDVNSYFKFEIKDSIKHFLEKNSTSQNNSTSIKSKQFKSALRFYNRLKESIAYLSKTFEVVSVEHIMRAIFYVLHDVHDLFAKELDDNKIILKELHLSFSERKTTHLEMDNMPFENSNLNQEEKNLLAFVVILIESRTMHFQGLLNVFESIGGDTKCMASAEHYLFLKKKRKCFAVDDEGNVRLKENHASTLILDGFFKDVNLKSSLETAELKGSGKNAFTLAVDPSRKCKSSSGNIQRDVLYGIHDICNDVLSLTSRCNKKYLHEKIDNPDVLSTVITEPSTESTVSIGATENESTREGDSSLPKNYILSQVPLGKTVSETENVVPQLSVSTRLQVEDRVCIMTREGMVFLFEHFKCRLDLHLVCVVLHALHEAKCPFLLLSQSEQIGLVGKILEPLWIAGVEDNSGTFLRPSSEAFGLNKEQRNLLFISYAVGQSEKLNYSTLLGMFEKHKMDLTELVQMDVYFKYKRDFFSVDEAECIELENFPPAKWMDVRLSSVHSIPADLPSTSVVQSGSSQMVNSNLLSLADLSLKQTGISTTVPTDENAVEGGDTKKNGKGSIGGTQATYISEYSQATLDHLAVRVFNGIAYLLQFFELNVFAGLLEVVLHATPNCAMFFGMPSTQQMEVIRASFSAFHIDGHGRVFSVSTENPPAVVSTKAVKMLLFMTYLISRKGSVHYHVLFNIYHECVNGKRHLKDSYQLKYFKERNDVFFVSGDGHVSLVNFSTVQFNYISILMSDRIPGPTFVNTGAVMPRMNPSPIIFNSGAAFPRINFTPLIFNTNAFMPQMICTPTTFVPVTVMPSMNVGPLIFNTSAFMPQTNCNPVLSTLDERNRNEIPEAQNQADAVKGKSFTKETESQVIVHSSSQKENLSMVQHSKDEPRTLTETSEEEAKRVKDGILYLSQYFVLEADDLTLILYALDDVKSHFLKLALQARDDFVKKCVSHLVLSSRGPFSITPASTLNDEEKIALFVVLLVSREKELHYTQIYDKFPQYNASKPVRGKSVLDQYELVTKWKHVFSVSPNGNVRLLPILVKNSDVCSIDNVTLDTNKTNPSVNGNVNFKFESNDSIKSFLEKNSTAQNNSTGIKCKHIRFALRFYNSIKESIVYLGKTFESVSAEQIIKAIFYVQHDFRVLFVKKIAINKIILEAMHLSFKERKTTGLCIDKLTFELLNLNQEEKNLLALICILIESPTMHYQELFNVFQSHGGGIKSSEIFYLYLKKKKRYFLTKEEGDVSLLENYALSSFNLDGFLKDVDLKTSFQSAVLEGSNRNVLDVAEGRRSKCKSSSGCIEMDVLCGIHDICNDVLSFYKQMRCNTKSLHGETDKQSLDVLPTIEAEPSTESTISIGVTKTMNDFVPINLMDMKPTAVSTEHAINDNQMIHINGNESSIVSEFPKSNKLDLSDHSNSVQSIEECQKNFTFMDSVKPFSFTSKDIPIDGSSQSNASQASLTFHDLSREHSRTDCSSACQDETDSNIVIDSSVASPPSYRSSSVPVEDCDKVISRNSAPIFNLLELLNDDDSSAASVESFANSCMLCGCTKDSIKERRTRNFFIVILGQSKIGFSVPVLRKKLLLASSEVQHYISCVYKDNIFDFLQNHDNFYTSPTSGNVCCKK